MAGTYAIFIPINLDFSMHLAEEKRTVGNFNSNAGVKTPVHPGSVRLRQAIRRNIVSFPSQIPVFLKKPPADMQWRTVILFFVRGWTSPKIAARFNVPTHRIWEVLDEWSVRALALGCVQIIDAKAFAKCCRIDEEGQDNHDTDENRLSAISPTDRSVSWPFAAAEEEQVSHEVA